MQAADLIFLGEDLYDRIPADVESKLMPFQREGIRYSVSTFCKSILCVMVKNQFQDWNVLHNVGFSDPQVIL